MRRHPILWLLAGAYLLVVGLWPPAATPINVATTGAFTVLMQPAVFLAVVVVGLLTASRRRPTPAPARRH